MKSCLHSIGVAAFCAAATVQAQTTLITYQGHLIEGAAPAAGEYLFEFQLFEGAADGTAVGDAVATGPTAVSDGLFTALLDFGDSLLDPAARWLEVRVRTNAVEAGWSLLAPRQLITAAPVAVVAEHARGAERADSADSAVVAEGVATGSITAGSVAPSSLLGLNLAADQVVRSLNGRRDDVLLQGGTNVLVTPTGAGFAVHAHAWGLEGNAGTEGAGYFLGTTDSAPIELKVSNRRVMRYEISSNSAVSVLGGDEGNAKGPDITGVTIAGGGTTFGGTVDWLHRVDALYGTIGGGMAHRIGTNAASSTISGGFSNQVSNLAELAVIAGGGNNVIGENAFRSTIGGGYQNGIAPGAYFSTVGGGWTNQVGAYISTISGGTEHHIGPGATYSTIGGGAGHRIEGTARTGTIAGGGENRIQTGSIRATIGGGKDNVIGSNSSHTFIGGGLGNSIGDGAEGAVIPGGISNRVDGVSGFAAGQQARALHAGALVWADASPWPFASETANQVALRATGGMRVVTGVDGEGGSASGVDLPAGSGSWASLSDETAKTDFESVDELEILEEVSRLRLRSWRYRAEESSTRHMGPVSQDFHAAFGLGANDRTIATVDADGVALAAIQGLYRLIREQQAEIEALRLRLESLTGGD